MQFFVGVFVFSEDDTKEKSDFSRFFFFRSRCCFAAFAVAVFRSWSVGWFSRCGAKESRVFAASAALHCAAIPLRRPLRRVGRFFCRALALSLLPPGRARSRLDRRPTSVGLLPGALRGPSGRFLLPVQSRRVALPLVGWPGWPGALPAPASRRPSRPCWPGWPLWRCGGLPLSGPHFCARSALPDRAGLVAGWPGPAFGNLFALPGQDPVLHIKL